MQGRLVGKGELVGAHRQTTPLLGAVDAPLNSVALLVRLGIETRWAASCMASPQAVSDLVGGLRDDGTDAGPAEMPADCTGGIRTIRQDGRRPGPGSVESASPFRATPRAGPPARCVKVSTTKARWTTPTSGVTWVKSVTRHRFGAGGYDVAVPKAASW
ncbi:hypothetical protein GCM10023335_75320 [Streptomyces siamensis]|uniref:Uncharacterized protein n=1 Tax=Streptomyces siamensis TaxID=1274986 RepID=A0ABP9JIH6_9ACTN